MLVSRMPSAPTGRGEGLLPPSRRCACVRGEPEGAPGRRGEVLGLRAAVGGGPIPLLDPPGNCPRNGAGEEVSNDRANPHHHERRRWTHFRLHLPGADGSLRLAAESSDAGNRRIETPGAGTLEGGAGALSDFRSRSLRREQPDGIKGGWRIRFRLADDAMFENLAAVVPASDTDAGEGLTPRVPVLPAAWAQYRYGSVASTCRMLLTEDGNPAPMVRRDIKREGNIRDSQGTAIASAAADDPAAFAASVLPSYDTDSGGMTVQRQFTRDYGSVDYDQEVRREGLAILAASWNKAITQGITGHVPGLVGMVETAAKTNAQGKDALTVDNVQAVFDRMNESGYLTEGAGGTGGSVSWQAHPTALGKLWALFADDRRATVDADGTLRLYGIRVMRNEHMGAFDAAGTTGDTPLLLMNGAHFCYRESGAPDLYMWFDSASAVAGYKIEGLVYHRRGFGASSAVTAGDGVNDATRSSALAAIVLP